MFHQIEGSLAVAKAVALCRPEVVSCYPITPQTHIVEAVSALVKSGELSPCEFVNVESEFAAMSLLIGASALQLSQARSVMERVGAHAHNVILDMLAQSLATLQEHFCGDRKIARLPRNPTHRITVGSRRAGQIARNIVAQLSQAPHEPGQRFGSERVGAYERLLLDVIDGRLNLFVRADEQEEAWQWVEPVMAHWANDASGPRPYAPGTWGPSASSAMIARDGHCWSEEC